MAKSLAASQDIMKNYLSELLTDTDPLVMKEQVPQFEERSETKTKSKIESKRLEKLLQNVNADLTPTTEELAEEYKASKKQVEIESKSKGVVEPPVLDTEKSFEKVSSSTLAPIQSRKSQDTPLLVKEKSYREGAFQAMFFDVAGLLIAVPLIELGGIHNVDKTTSLMGKPPWFKGVMLHRDEKVNVVDTALWVMPEKCDDALINSLNYQYVIMLSDSQWGLMAEHLVDTVTLEQDQVKWLDKPSKRPWLAGLVKERMCALLDVEALIKLLDDGVGII
jgi:purine-binding chemotaxis protein CheW